MALKKKTTTKKTAAKKATKKAAAPEKIEVKEEPPVSERTDRELSPAEQQALLPLTGLHATLSFFSKPVDFEQGVKVLQEAMTPTLRAILEVAFSQAITPRIPLGFTEHTPAEENTNNWEEAMARTMAMTMLPSPEVIEDAHQCLALFEYTLENLDEANAKIMIAAKDKVLHMLYPGLLPEIAATALPDSMINQQ